MTAPRWLARANRHLANRFFGPLAPWLPGFGVLQHTGRKSGRQYRTPINVFRHGNRYFIALTYGPESDWVQNVLASGGTELKTRGRTVKLCRPRIMRDEQRRAVPVIARPILGLAGVSDFLVLDLEATPSPLQTAKQAPG
ncbi:MAG TPA: nitroreductase family deazaflavin-dependent oxidoreductase [Chloroflexota bacterium]|nr:nitroreductase family deazaflavin-dependent oxidoreductase [Chloroflexota bacterium]